MVVTWVTLLKTVPWTEVIANAPAITEGAKKLWNTVARKPGTTDGAAESGTVQASSRTAVSGASEELLARVQAQVEVLNGRVTELESQMLTSTELIRAVADQNTELIARVEAHRRRLLWLTGGLAVVAVIAAVALGRLLLAAAA